MQFELKLTILKHGLTQRAVAAKAGIPEGKVSEIVRGWRPASDQERQRIAEAIGCSVEEAFGASLAEASC